MTKGTAFSLLLMVILSVATIWEDSLFYYSFVLGFVLVVLNGLLGQVSFKECGISFFSIGNFFKKSSHRQLFFYPLLAVAAEVLLGEFLFENFSEYALKLIDHYLIFNNSATLIWITLLMIAIEEIPWRCHFQLHISRQLPNGWALLLPAISLCILAVPSQINTLSIYCLSGIFLRRLLWGMLYEHTHSVWVVVLSHFLAVMFYLILLVGL
ncbi:MAG: hypothetical protein EOM59_03505 [Clostridia bacterium]|nr:hypothetical protein [Clostridia bacterium]